MNLRTVVGLVSFGVAVAGGVPASGELLQPASPPAKPAEKPSEPPAPQPKPATPQEKSGDKPAGEKPSEQAKPEDDAAYVLNFTVKDINGADQKLDQYKGKVILIVNVASQCGFTPQYEALQRLYEKHQEEGLVVLGFPANNFNNQEPGTDAQIKEFCSSKYGVTFPMFSKISVTGEGQHPLYKKMAALPSPLGGEPKWNFSKYLVDRSGKVVAHYTSKAKPDDTKDAESKAMNDKIEELLKAK